jgi:murein endopeptidase
MKKRQLMPGTRTITLLAVLGVGASAIAADERASSAPSLTVAPAAPVADLPAPPPVEPAAPAVDPAPEPNVAPAASDVPPVAAEAVLPELAPTGAEALRVTAQTDPAALGPLSIGTPDSGLLVNPVPFPEGPYWVVRDPSESWGTEETIDSIITAIEAVQSRYPGSPRVVIGDLSHPGGGRLDRHKSHQAGRDADVGFFYQRGEADSFVTARKKDLDLPRTWGLVRAFVTETDIDRIFVDRSLIAVLYQYAVDEGEDRGWLNDIFGRTSEKGIIQHERRHKDHMHVRFYNPRAQEAGRIVYPILVEAGVAPPPMVKHRVRQGETLGTLARHYGTSASAIRAANGLRSSQLRAGRTYTIPIRRTPPDTGPVVVPPRRLPPEMQARASNPAEHSLEAPALAEER